MWGFWIFRFGLVVFSWGLFTLGSLVLDLGLCLCFVVALVGASALIDCFVSHFMGLPYMFVCLRVLGSFSGCICLRGFPGSLGFTLVVGLVQYGESCIFWGFQLPGFCDLGWLL